MLSRLFFDCFKKPRYRNINGVSTDLLLRDEKEVVITIKKEDKSSLHEPKDPLTQVRKDHPPTIIRRNNRKEYVRSGSSIICSLMCSGSMSGILYGLITLSKESHVKKDYAMGQYNDNPNLLNPYYPNTTCAEVFSAYNITSADNFCAQYYRLNQNFNMSVSYDVFNTCYQTLDECHYTRGGLSIFLVVMSVFIGMCTTGACCTFANDLYNNCQIYSYNNTITYIISKEEKSVREKLFLSLETLPQFSEEEKAVRDIYKIAHKIGLFRHNTTILKVIDGYFSKFDELEAKQFIRLSMPYSILKKPKVNLDEKEDKKEDSSSSTNELTSCSVPSIR